MMPPFPMMAPQSFPFGAPGDHGPPGMMPHTGGMPPPPMMGMPFGTPMMPMGGMPMPPPHSHLPPRASSMGRLETPAGNLAGAAG